VSHPEMRMVGAAIGVSYPFSIFSELWCMLVSVWFHNLVIYAQRLQDLNFVCLMFWKWNSLRTRKALKMGITVLETEGSRGT
jgi:hypothetical protein